MRIFSKISWGMIALVAGCSPLDKTDEVRLTRFIRDWSPYVVVGPEPFAGHKEWAFNEREDSQAVAYLRRLQEWEGAEHARIDSLSDRPPINAIKREMHGLIRGYIALCRLDVTFPHVASQLEPSFLTAPTARGDSLLSLACGLLGAIDSVGMDIAVHGHEFNRLWRSLGETDTLRYRHRIPVRERIVKEYVWFLEPELKRFLLIHQ